MNKKKLTKEELKFLKDNPKGKLKDLPTELKEMFDKQFKTVEKMIKRKLDSS